MLAVVAEFAATFVNPLAASLVLVAAFAWPKPWQARASAVTVGAAFALPSLGSDLPGWQQAAMVAAAAAAALLQAEVALSFVLPAWRLGLRIARGARRRLLAARPLRRSAAGATDANADR